MKKTLRALALVAMMVSLGLGAVPVAATSVESETVTASASSVSEKVAVAVKQAEVALDATAGGAAGAVANAKEVAAMRTYLRGLIQRAQGIDLNQLTAAQATELKAALEEGARGLRMTAGVDRKPAATGSNVSGGSVDGAAAEGVGGTLTSGTGAVSAGSSDKGTISGTVPEPKVMKELAKVEAASGSARVSGETAVSDNAGAEGESTGVKAEVVAGLVSLASAQVKKPVVAQVDEEDEVEVPKTGASDEERTSSAARGMGLILGGAVVFAAAVGAVLIVKRMKRDL